MKRKFIVALIILILLAVIFQIVVPRLVSRELKKGLEGELEAGEVVVRTSSFPVFKLLWGQVDSLELKGEDLVIDGLKVDRLGAEFKNLLLKQEDQYWLVSSGTNSYLYLKVDEESLNNYLADLPELEVFEELRVDLIPGRAMIVGQVNIVIKIPIQVEGDFRIDDSGDLIFFARQVAVGEMLISEDIISRLKDELEVRINLTDFPLPLNVEEVKINDGKIEVFGESEKKE